MRPGPLIIAFDGTPPAGVRGAAAARAVGRPAHRRRVRRAGRATHRPGPRARDARAAEAVLETLAERVSGGEVEDLETRLALELHAALERGRAASGDRARSMPLQSFLRRVAEREGVTPEALVHARAVLATLREAVGEEEFSDVMSELPANYKRTLVPADGRSR